MSTGWQDPSLSPGDSIQFETTGVMPAGLLADTSYFVESLTDGGGSNYSITVSASQGGAAINFTDAGSGTLKIVIPDREIIIDQWGYPAWMVKLAFKDRVELTLAEDPDGDGPRFAGEKIISRPKTSELRSKVYPGGDLPTTCKSNLDGVIANSKANMTPPSPLDSSVHTSRLDKQSKPIGSFPPRVMEGTPIIDDNAKAALGLN